MSTATNPTGHPVGTTAIATVRTVPGVPVMAVSDGDQAGWLSAYPVLTFTFHPPDQITDVAPTYPLDLVDGDLDALDQAAAGAVTEQTTATLVALRERIVRARAGAARPSEPMRRGAVAVDVDGREWVRVASPGIPAAWFQHATRRYAVPWTDFQPIRVVS